MASGPVISTATFLAFSLAQGGLLILPWLLLAHYLPPSRFAILGVLLSFITPFGSFFTPFAASLIYSTWGQTGAATLTMALALASIAIASRLPRPTTPIPQPAD